MSVAAGSGVLFEAAEVVARRRAKAAVVLAGTLVSAGAVSVLPARSLWWWAAALVLGVLVGAAWRVFQDPVEELQVSSAVVRAAGGVELFRGDVSQVGVVARPGWSGPMVSRLCFVSRSGQVDVVRVARLRLAPAEVVSALVGSGWPLPGRATAVPERVVRVPTGAAIVRRACVDLGLVVGVAVAMLVVLDFDTAGPPVAALAVVSACIGALITVVAVTRIGWCVRVRVGEGGVVVESARSVVVLPASEVTALGQVGGSLWVRNGTGTWMRVLPLVPSRALAEIEAAAVACGLRWDPAPGRDGGEGPGVD